MVRHLSRIWLLRTRLCRSIKLTRERPSLLLRMTCTIWQALSVHRRLSVGAQLSIDVTWVRRSPPRLQSLHLTCLAVRPIQKIRLCNRRTWKALLRRLVTLIHLKFASRLSITWCQICLAETRLWIKKILEIKTNLMAVVQVVADSHWWANMIELEWTRKVSTHWATRLSALEVATMVKVLSLRLWIAQTQTAASVPHTLATIAVSKLWSLLQRAQHRSTKIVRPTLVAQGWRTVWMLPSIDVSHRSSLERDHKAT